MSKAGTAPMTGPPALSSLIACRFPGVQLLIDPSRHFTPFGDGPHDYGFDDPLASHSSLVSIRLGFKAPVA